MSPVPTNIADGIAGVGCRVGVGGCDGVGVGVGCGVFFVGAGCGGVSFGCGCVDVSVADLRGFVIAWLSSSIARVTFAIFIACSPTAAAF